MSAARWTETSTHRFREMIDSYFDALQDASEAYERETRAAIRIQKIFHGFRQRKRMRTLTNMVVKIQRLFRGYQARKRVRELWKARECLRQAHFFHCMAVTIQRIYRGYRSRKFAFDYRKRKNELLEAKRLADWVRASAQEYRETVTQMLEEEHQRRSQEEFDEVTRNLHHLLGTQSIPGIYGVRSGVSLRGMDSTLEDQLRKIPVFDQKKKKSLRPISENSPSNRSDSCQSSDDMRSSRMSRKKLGPFRADEELKSVKNREISTSIQASDEYNALEKKRREEDMIERAMLARQPKFAVRAPAPPPPVTSVHSPTLRPIRFRDSSSEKSSTFFSATHSFAAFNHQSSVNHLSRPIASTLRR